MPADRILPAPLTRLASISNPAAPPASTCSGQSFDWSAPARDRVLSSAKEKLMGQPIPLFFARLREWESTPVPPVDPADIRAVSNYARANIGPGTENIAVSHSIYERLCSPGADILAVWYRSSLFGMTLSMMAAPLADFSRGKLPNVPLPDQLFPAPDWLREDMKQSQLPDYLFDVIARFPLNGPAKDKGMNLNFGAFIAELERARAAHLPGDRETNMTNQSGSAANDLLRDRQPSAHEREHNQPWDTSYHHGPAPWDIGRPQAAVVRVAAAGGFTGAVLDAGCGTGENTLHIAALGLPVLGVDVAQTALAMAREKAHERGSKAEFAAADAFHLERLGRKFDTVLDCGLFHTFEGDERARYVASVALVTEPGATLYVLCFSDAEPDAVPHPVREDELRAAFMPTAGWKIGSLEATRIETRMHEHGAPAWLATIKRI